MTGSLSATTLKITSGKELSPLAVKSPLDENSTIPSSLSLSPNSCPEDGLQDKG